MLFLVIALEISFYYSSVRLSASEYLENRLFFLSNIVHQIRKLKGYKIYRGWKIYQDKDMHLYCEQIPTVTDYHF